MSLPAAATARVDADEDVLALYLFGSRAEGVARPDSDWDIAVLWREGLARVERATRRYALIEELSHLLGARVDVVDLRAAPLLLAARAIRGELVFEREPTTRALFEARVASREEDELIAARWVRAAMAT